MNQYIEEDKRPVPFRRMIYVGDGTTDIPCMRLVKNSGGHSIAVYNPEIRNARRELNGLIRDNRVSHVCPADYSEGSEMDTLVKTIIDKIEADHRLELLETPARSTKESVAIRRKAITRVPQKHTAHASNPK